MNHLGSEMEQERRIDLVTVHRFGLPLEELREIDGEDIDDPHSSGHGNDGCERLLVRIMTMGGEKNEFLEPSSFPGVEQIVQHAVKSFLPHGRVADEAALGVDVDTVLDGGSAQHAELGRKVVGKPLGYDRCGAEREMRSVLLAGSDRDDQI